MLTVRTRVAWHGPRFVRTLHRHILRSTQDAGDYLKGVVVAEITARQGSYSPQVHSWPNLSGRVHPAHQAAQATYFFDRTKPGDPPFKITGHVAASYKTFLDRPNLSLMLYSDDPVARYLELGTTIMNPRPHLRKNLIDHRAALARIMCRPL